MMRGVKLDDAPTARRGCDARHAGASRCSRPAVAHVIRHPRGMLGGCTCELALVEPGLTKQRRPCHTRHFSRAARAFVRNSREAYQTSKRVESDRRHSRDILDRVGGGDKVKDVLWNQILWALAVYEPHVRP